MWLKLETGMLLMLLLFRVLWGSKGEETAKKMAVMTLAQ